MSLIRAARAEGLLHELMASTFTIVAAGKAARPMAHALAELYPSQVRQALVAGPVHAGAPLPAGWEACSPAHPFPNRVSVEAGAAALRVARHANRELLVLLLSGGASSMLCLPAEGIALEDKVAASKAMMDAGVPIAGINCVRKHLSAIKGGQLGAAAGRSLTIAISDVHDPVPDDPAVIGSGPAAADPTTFAQALEVVAGVHGIPVSVCRRLEEGAAGRLSETIKPGDGRLEGARFLLLANRMTALRGAARSAAAKGYAVVVIDDVTRGEARDAAMGFMRRAEVLLRHGSCPVCVLAAGETTVRVTGTGKGGRNQEFVLSAIPRLDEIDAPAVLASFGTDGRDGPTDAAGALADSSTQKRATLAGLDRARALADNDAYPFFAALGDLIVPGPTGTNVGDLQVLLVG